MSSSSTSTPGPTPSSTPTNPASNLKAAIGLDFTEYKMEKLSQVVNQANSAYFHKHFQALQTKMEKLLQVVQAWETLIVCRNYKLETEEVAILSRERDEIMKILFEIEKELMERYESNLANGQPPPTPCNTCHFPPRSSHTPLPLLPLYASPPRNQPQRPLETMPPDTPQDKRLEQLLDSNLNTPATPRQSTAANTPCPYPFSPYSA